MSYSAGRKFFLQFKLPESIRSDSTMSVGWLAGMAYIYGIVDKGELNLKLPLTEHRISLDSRD
jgi:hypothetical protein